LIGKIRICKLAQSPRAQNSRRKEFLSGMTGGDGKGKREREGRQGVKLDWEKKGREGKKGLEDKREVQGYPQKMRL